MIAFTPPVYGTYYTAVIKTKPKSSFFVIEPLQYSVWLSYAGMAVLVAAALSIIDNVFHTTKDVFSFNKPYLLCSVMWTCFRVIVNQGRHSFFSFHKMHIYIYIYIHIYICICVMCVSVCVLRSTSTLIRDGPRPAGLYGIISRESTPVQVQVKCGKINEILDKNCRFQKSSIKRCDIKLVRFHCGWD